MSDELFFEPLTVEPVADVECELDLSCPHCGCEGLSLGSEWMFKYQVRCDCGVSGPYSLTLRDAVKGWLSLKPGERS